MEEFSEIIANCERVIFSGFTSAKSTDLNWLNVRHLYLVDVPYLHRIQIITISEMCWKFWSTGADASQNYNF